MIPRVCCQTRRGPVDRDFWVWRRDREFTKAERKTSEVFRAAGLTYLDPNGTTINFRFLPNGPIYIATVSRKPKPAAVLAPKPKPAAVLAPKPTPEAESTVADVAVLKAQVAELQATVAKLVRVINLSELKTD